jgi:hypothetical protein
MNIKDKLISALTAYDAKQAKKKGYNQWALPQYFERADQIWMDICAGADVRSAIIAGFNGPLVDYCLRSLGLAVTTPEESNKIFIYKPINNLTNKKNKHE